MLLQNGLAAGLAWYIAHEIIGHQAPFFAPVAASIALGLAATQRVRRTIELIIGVALGVAVGDLFIMWVGVGVLQVGLVVVLAMATALLIGAGSVMVAQAGSSAILVATLQPPTEGIYYQRWIDTLIGGLVGLAVSALLLPLNPLRAVQRAAKPVFARLSDGLAGVADALQNRDLGAARSALDLLRSIDKPLAAFRTEAVGASEHAEVAPVWWRSRDQLRSYADAALYVLRAVTNSQVLARRALSVVRMEEPIPATMVEAMRDLSDAVEQLHRDFFGDSALDEVRGTLLSAVAATTNSEDSGFSGRVVYAQVRTIAHDLLRVSGLDEDAVRAATRRALQRT